ncbi:hypothetical protein EK599_01355 [Vibrio sp. T187]|uniref:MliC family protein n=1 Tax=Vibrio TaxID=662 RepID=UPI0010C9DA8F|nr:MULTISPECIES: MliC family protein [Vibrio]MBW3694323.1 hypothetical protein [Vibrio sp. T187]
MKMTWLFASLGSLLVMGCSQSASVGDSIPDGKFTRYQCESNSSFEVAYLNDGKAVLRLPQHEYRLVQVAAGSGTKYILDDGTAELLNSVTLHTKGEKARLELGRVIYKNCHL